MTDVTPSVWERHLASAIDINNTCVAGVRVHATDKLPTVKHGGMEEEALVAVSAMPSGWGSTAVPPVGRQLFSAVSSQPEHDLLPSP